MDRKIEDLGLSVRTLNALKRGGIDTVEELAAASRANRLAVIRGMGTSCLEEIGRKLDELRQMESLPEEKGLVYLEVDRIYPHPQNPRKDLGDLEELTQSIKANGIMQNLTVIPGHWMDREEYARMAKAEGITLETARMMWDGSEWSPDGYTVIIGHRRLAAARAAGQKLVPCIVTQMDEARQVSTMLLENMQRSDLTVYEEAQGFQLMLDMGETVGSVAEKTGFSESTIRRRTKLLDLDKEQFAQAQKRGATLEDYAKLDQLESVAAKNKVLEAIGTKNFANRLLDAVQEEKGKKYLDECQAELEKWAKRLSKARLDEDRNSYQYICNFNIYGKKQQPTQPENTLGRECFFVRHATEIDLYIRRQAQQQDMAEDLERQEKQKENRRKRDELGEMAARHFELRKEFVKEFTPVHAEEKDEICRFAAMLPLDWRYHRADLEILGELLGLGEDTEDEEVTAAFEEEKKAHPARALLYSAYAAEDSENQRSYENDWDSQAQCYCAKWQPNNKLTDLYRLLEALGYEISDEEEAMMNGSHVLFY